MLICSEGDLANFATTPTWIGRCELASVKREDPVLGPLFHWLEEDKRPSWEEIAPHGVQVKAYPAPMADVGFEGWPFV